MSDSKGLIVVVEDERAIAELQRLYLTEAGFGVHLERDGAAGLARIRQLRPVAVVLDVGLPGMDGIEVCRRLRESGDWTPVIFVTARDDEVDRILGLELGADDYLTKPFSPRELVARIRTILRRLDGPGTKPVLQVGAVRMDVAARTVTVGGASVTLTSTEFDLLAKLAGSPGRVFTREELLSSVWGQADYASGRTVDVHVAQVRAKLGEASPIRTSRGVGYAAVDEP
ncbi:response regulator transcription factor [Galbitalea soli]|uniref:Response regulator transcription factor n=1 Tax=Galbitalea soli TaxID=1268042 RepID=A0A7C9TRT1_9MICO|nr:response regulator transcription factor [Galbitalea soli]NEM91544.1 response regulator transcription factor [Galbitalea soli]NYJ30238.1 DNA-binding response OmpR family regulator [Galbitalea soli]